MKTLVEIPGVDLVCIEKLRDAGIPSIDAFLEVCVRAKGRYLLAERTGIPRMTILGLANHADLLRVNGVGSEYANLLQAAGVETVPELSRRNAAKLRKKLVEVQGAQHEDCTVPSEAEIADWIEQARELPRILQY